MQFHNRVVRCLQVSLRFTYEDKMTQARTYAYLTLSTNGFHALLDY